MGDRISCIVPPLKVTHFCPPSKFEAPNLQL